jgi:hypothetical protein
MRFKRVYLLSIAVLLLCASLSLGKKPVKPEPPPPAENTVLAGFVCDDLDPQPVCTTYGQEVLDEFERTELYSFAAGYQSTEPIYLQSNLGEPFQPFVRNDPDNICGLLGESLNDVVIQSSDAEGETVFENAAVVPATKFNFSGNTNTYEASVGWKFFNLMLEHPILGPVTLPKVTFFYKDETFVGFDQEDDPFVGGVTTIENWAVLARVEGYVPDGAKRGKGIQCFWMIDDPDDGVQNPVVFTVDGTQ